LGFARGLNRTLVLPAWIEYRKGEAKSIQVPFDKYFKIAPLLEYTSVMTMEKFMKDLAPTIWPPESRISFCYTERMSIDGSLGKGCNAKDGNPFGPFWDTYGVDFIDSEFYGPKLNYDVYHHSMGERWNEHYPSDKWPVLAFTGAPAVFPVQEDNRHLHKYLKWSDQIDKRANEVIKTTLPHGAFIGIHLRNGMDWVRACEHVKDSTNLFSSPQCLGYRNERGSLTHEMCFATKDLIIRQLKRTIKRIKEKQKNNEIKSIFVASDNNHMLMDLNTSLKRMGVVAIQLAENDPHVDLAILGRANHFIGNCVSSFTAFVVREREAKKLPYSFWGFPKEKPGDAKRRAKHEEL
jgi:peptide-O-fucosyltransferase